MKCGPKYPLVVEPILAGRTSVFLMFSVNTTPMSVAETLIPAWIDASAVTIGSPVTVRAHILGTKPPTCPAPSCQPSKPYSLAAADGHGIIAGAPVTFSTFSSATGVTGLFGWDEASDGTLLYSSPSVPQPAVTQTNFTVTPVARLDHTLATGKPNVVESALTSRSLRALPTVNTGVYTLAWKPFASSEGLPISITRLYSTQPCLACYRDFVPFGYQA